MSEKTQEQYAYEVEQARAKLEDARAQLMKIPGVIDVLPGIKVTGGQATEEVVLQVFVERKKPPAELSPAELIPPRIAGIATDVISLSGIVPEDLVSGGVGLTQSFWGASNGTVGGVGIATAGNTHVPVNTPLLLTNHHVASSIGGAVGTGCLCDSWCCECCAIGHLIDAGQTASVDGAIATLNPGVHFSHEILNIGAVRGSGAAAMGMAVVKYGDTSGYTEGSVAQVSLPPYQRGDGTTMAGQMMIAPTPPYKRFSAPGDSGSVYVAANTRQVIGLHHSGNGVQAFGCHIAAVTALLQIDFPVMGTAGAVPLAGLAVAERPRVPDHVLTLRRDLEQTESGKRWLELIHLHEAEVRRLVNNDRATKVAWQRSQGPGFLAHFLKSARDGTHRVPREIGGTRVENAIVTMAAVLQQHGSPALRGAIAEHYLTVLECAQRAESAEEAVANIRRLAGAPRRREPNGR